MAEERLIYRAEVTAIIGALADLVVEVRQIRRFLEEPDDEEGGNETKES